MAKVAPPVVRDLMTRKLITLRPEMPAVDAAELLLKHGISGAPVVDAEGRLLGLLSEYDCLRAVASAEYQMDRHDARETVAELMTTAAQTIAPDADLFTLAHAFVTKGVRRFPVVEGGRLLGQVSRRDALRGAVQFRKAYVEGRPSYPDYPEGRSPIRDYPRGQS